MPHENNSLTEPSTCSVILTYPASVVESGVLVETFTAWVSESDSDKAIEVAIDEMFKVNGWGDDGTIERNEVGVIGVYAGKLVELSGVDNQVRVD